MATKTKNKPKCPTFYRVRGVRARLDIEHAAGIAVGESLITGESVAIRVFCGRKDLGYIDVTAQWGES